MRASLHHTCAALHHDRVPVVEDDDVDDVVVAVGDEDKR